MNIAVVVQDGITVIHLVGSIDGNTAAQVQERIMPLIVFECRLVLDLNQCQYISSAGLRVLLMIAKQLSAKRGHWAFAGLSEEIKDVMDMTGFGGFFATFATIAEAAAAVRRPTS